MHLLFEIQSVLGIGWVGYRMEFGDGNLGAISWMELACKVYEGVFFFLWPASHYTSSACIEYNDNSNLNIFGLLYHTFGSLVPAV